MGFLDWLLPKPEPQEKFAQQWSASDPAFAAWWFGEQSDIESVTPYTVLGLSAVLRSVQIISTSIAGLPLRTFERQGEDRVRVPSVFDDPYPGIDGMTPFAWVETVLIHLLLWREAFLWHEDRDAQGFVTVYRPILPDAFTVKRENGKRLFEFTENGEKKTVGSEQITYIPGPSLDGVRGHPLLYAARSVFSAAISGDRTAQTVLRRGIRLAGLITPGDENEDFDATEGAAILEQLRANVVGRENAGDVAIINRRLKLQPWTPNNIESQWAETKALVLGDIERLFGMPPHLLADTEKQTSWGTGVAEQNRGLAQFTLKGWSDRIEQVLRLRVPRGQFVEFDYKGLLQGTPAEEITLLIAQKEAGILTVDEVRKILNLPPLTTAQKAELAPPPPVAPPVEPSGFADLSRYVERQNGHDALLAAFAARESSITVNTPAAAPLSIAPGAVQVDIAPPHVTVAAAPAPDVHVDIAPITVAAAPTPDVHVDIAPITVEAAPVPEVHVDVAPPTVMVDLRPPMRTVIDEVDGEIVGSHEEPIDG